MPSRDVIWKALRVASAVCAIALVGATPKPVKADGPLYTLTDLGSLGCCNWWIWESEAIGLNNVGDIVGVTTAPADPSIIIPFIYRDGRMAAIRDWWGEAHGINDAGQAVGFVVRPGEVVARAFVYRDGIFTDLGTLPSRDHSATAYGINSTGTMAPPTRARGL
jgi:probable HAF family extracellular repeat protein